MPRKPSETVPVRDDEELPMEELETYLLSCLPGAASPLVVEQFAEGHSNLTYLVTLGGTEMVLRRGPFGNQVKTAHDMAREYRVLSKLSKHYPPAPYPLLFCDNPAVIGGPFYVMERRHGLILRKRLPPGLEIDPEAARQVSTALVDALADLHSLDYRAAGLGDLGKPEGYVARQVAGWAERYVKARTDELPAMDRVSAWLGEHMPRESGSALIHNDFKYDNLMLNPKDLTQVVAVLDWEMATVGDPLMDLGTTLGYWVEAGDSPALRHGATGPTDLPGSLTRRELVGRYEERTGREVADPVFYYAFGLYKIAVIVQQIYARFERGHTRDDRFANLNGLVAVLARQADRSIEAGRL